jgi:hypothetical protein
MNKFTLFVSLNISCKHRQIKMSGLPMSWMTCGVRRSHWAGNRPGRMDSDQAGSWEEGLHRLQRMSETSHSHFPLCYS